VHLKKMAAKTECVGVRARVCLCVDITKYSHIPAQNSLSKQNSKIHNVTD